MGAIIGVFDSGVGGLSVLKALRAELPHEHFSYVADSGHAPYGEKSDVDVIARSRRITRWLVEAQQAKALVIACNTATAAAIHLLRADYPDIPIIGVEPALKPAAALSKTRRIGVMATRGTLASAKFKALLAAQPPDARFVLQACDGLAEAIERAAASGDDAGVVASCTTHLSAMGRFGEAGEEIDTLVLGCTHYPIAEALLQQLAGNSVRLVGNGEAVARQLRRQLPILESGPAAGSIQLWSSGSSASLRAGARHWLALTDAEPVSLALD